MKKKIFFLLFNMILFRLFSADFIVQNLEDFVHMTDEQYYDLYIEEEIRPENFLLTQNNAIEIFKTLVKENYDMTYLEIIDVEEYKEYYIVTGNRKPREIGIRDIIKVSNSEIILIIKKTDGSIISFIMTR